MLPRTHTGWLALVLASAGFFCALGLVQAQQRKNSPLNAGLKAGKKPAAAKAGKQKAAIPKNAKTQKGKKGGAALAPGSEPGLMDMIHDVFGMLKEAVQDDLPRPTVNHLNQALHQLLLGLTGRGQHGHGNGGHAGKGWHKGGGQNAQRSTPGGKDHGCDCKAKPDGGANGARGAHVKAKNVRQQNGLASNNNKGKIRGKGNFGSARNTGPKRQGPGANLGQGALARNAGKTKTNAFPNQPRRQPVGRTARQRSPLQGGIQSAVKMCVHIDVNVVVSREKHRGHFKRDGQALTKEGRAGNTARAKNVNAKSNPTRGNAKQAGAKSAAHHCGVKNAGSGQAKGQRAVGNIRGAAQNTKKAGGQARNPGACLGQKALAKAPGARKNGPTRNANLGNRTKGVGAKAGNRPVGLVKCDGKFAHARPGASSGNKAFAKKGGAAKGPGQIAAKSQLKNNGLRMPTQKGPARIAANKKGASQNLKAGRNLAPGMKKANVQKASFAAQKKSPQQANRMPANRPANLKQGFPRQFAPAQARAPQQQKMNRPQPMVAQRPVAFQRGMAQARTTGRRR
ncbi:MAG: hypothetical protein HYX68_25615 [Planctomycetes bacterium]|nr:hypothetical protein [Planctomycetota bacterium]